MAASCGRVSRPPATARARSPGGPGAAQRDERRAGPHHAVFGAAPCRHYRRGRTAVCPCRDRPVAPLDGQGDAFWWGRATSSICTPRSRLSPRRTRLRPPAARPRRARIRGIARRRRRAGRPADRRLLSAPTVEFSRPDRGVIGSASDSRSDRGIAAVDQKVAAGDKARAVAGQEHRGRGDFVAAGRAGPADASARSARARRQSSRNGARSARSRPLPATRC